MKKILTSMLTICICCNCFSQQKEKSPKNLLLEELSAGACKCIDSINVTDKSREEVTKEINKCIDAETGAYQLAAKLMGANDMKPDSVGKDGKKKINISINTNKNSDEYKQYYYEIERYLMSSCGPLKDKIATNEKQSAKSFSENPEALDLYSKGINESKKENYESAIKYFEKAIKIDPEFAFAWDNMGISYRKLNNYDKAIECYKKSPEIDPKGLMPLQNIAVVYQYKKEYQHAIDAYLKLAELDKNNPEIYFGIGQIYAGYLSDFEKGLDNMCMAYNLYTEQKSPYRTDAEKLIKYIYAEMKKQAKEDVF